MDGFKYPKIEQGKCIGCGKCNLVCDNIKSNYIKKTSKYIPEVWAAWSLDEKIRFNSTSGGIFFELAKSIIQKNGKVYAAAYTKDFLVEHCMVDNLNDLPKLMQSKYIQSDIVQVYSKILLQAKKGKLILFCGTPCQAAALNELAGGLRKNIIICDFICKGVNSPKVFLDYLSEIENQYNSKAIKVWFKNKQISWNCFGTNIVFENGDEYFQDRDNDLFMYGYIKNGLNLYLRPSCERCNFKGVVRASDITLADFWTIKLIDNTKDINHGVSAVILQTKKGKNIFENMEGRIYKEKHSIKEVLKGNHCMISSSVSKIEREEFWSMSDKPFSQRIKKIRGF